MDKLKICFSISVFDAFDDLHISARLIKDNWNHKYELYMIVNLCKPKTHQFIDTKLFDKVHQIETPITKNVIDNKENDNDAISRSARNFNSMMLSGIEAENQKCDTIIYLTSGSWVLDVEYIFKIIEDLGDRAFGVRMMSRLGYLMVEDHFLFVNLNKSAKYKLFRNELSGRVFNPVALGINGIHGILMSWLNQAPYGEVYVYSNHSRSINQHGKTPVSFIPLIYDPDYCFLHSNKVHNEVHYLRRRYIYKFSKQVSPSIDKLLGNSKLNLKKYKYINRPYPHIMPRYLLIQKLRMIYIFIVDVIFQNRYIENWRQMKPDSYNTNRIK